MKVYILEIEVSDDVTNEIKLMQEFVSAGSIAQVFSAVAVYEQEEFMEVVRVHKVCDIAQQLQGRVE